MSNNYIEIYFRNVTCGVEQSAINEVKDPHSKQHAILILIIQIRLLKFKYSWIMSQLGILAQPETQT